MVTSGCCGAPHPLAQRSVRAACPNRRVECAIDAVIAVNLAQMHQPSREACKFPDGCTHKALPPPKPVLSVPKKRGRHCTAACLMTRCMCRLQSPRRLHRSVPRRAELSERTGVRKKCRQTRRLRDSVRLSAVKTAVHAHECRLGSSHGHRPATASSSPQPGHPLTASPTRRRKPASSTGHVIITA